MNDTPNERPIVGEYMTLLPATINAGLRLSDALDRMYADNVRHLPVVDDTNALVGVVSTRDIALAASFRGHDPARVNVAAAMTPDPYAVTVDTPLDEVALQMEENRLGSALVTQDGEPVGIFTTTDALRAVRALALGKSVEPANPPTHRTGAEQTSTSPKSEHQHRRPQGASRYDGMVSWFLARL